MPPTRSQLARDDKITEIIDTADARLASGGIQALSISGVARELGLAHNAVYWYFPSRADLFVAVLRRRLTDIAARKPPRSQDIVGRVLWFTDQLGPLHQLQPAMQDLAREAPIVAEFVAELDALSERMLANVFRRRFEGDHLSIAIESFRSAVVGAYARGLPRDRRRRLLAFMLNQLLADHPSPKPHLTAKIHDRGREEPSS